MELTNREIAAAAWLIALLLFALTYAGIRLGLWRVVVAAAAPRLVIPALLYLAYLVAVLAVSSRAGLWDASLLGDVVIWLVVGALPLFGTFVRIEQPRFIRRTLLAAVTAPGVIAFVLELVDIPLIVALILLPTTSVLAMLSVVAGTKPEFSPVARLSRAALGMIGIGSLLWTAYRLVVGWGQVDWHHVTLTFYLPLWLTAAAIPLVYALGIYSRWEQQRLRMGRR